MCDQHVTLGSRPAVAELPKATSMEAAASSVWRQEPGEPNGFAFPRFQRWHVNHIESCSCSWMKQAKYQLSTLPRPGFAIAFAQGRRRLNLPGESSTKPSVAVKPLSDLSTLVSCTRHIHNYTRSLGLSEDNLPLLLYSRIAKMPL